MKFSVVQRVALPLLACILHRAGRPYTLNTPSITSPITHQPPTHLCITSLHKSLRHIFPILSPKILHPFANLPPQSSPNLPQSPPRADGRSPRHERAVTIAT